MSISTKSLMSGLQKEIRKLETQHGRDVPANAIKNPALKQLAQPVATSCTTSVVKTSQLKEALRTVGKDINRADANKDGRLNVGDQKRLSPLAARMLQAAGKEVAVDDEPRPVATGCGSSAPSRPVSTACGGSPPIYVPPPAPRPRPVATGCGASPAPAPVRTSC